MSDTVPPWPLPLPLPPLFELDQQLPGGWRVARLPPALRLELTTVDDLFRRAVIPVGPLLLGAALFAGAHAAGPGILKVALPVVALFWLVAALGVLALVRAIRRRRTGVVLEVDADAVTGYPEARAWLKDYFARLERHPRSEAKAVTLTVYRDPSRGTARAMLRLELLFGGALLGPEAAGADAEWAELKDRLSPAAEALAGSLGLKVTSRS